jgi:hypothetical protein
VREYQIVLGCLTGYSRKRAPRSRYPGIATAVRLARTTESGDDCRFTRIPIGLSHHVTKSALESATAELSVTSRTAGDYRIIRLMQLVCFKGVMNEHAG